VLIFGGGGFPAFRFFVSDVLDVRLEVARLLKVKGHVFREFGGLAFCQAESVATATFEDCSFYGFHIR
jgi:hypothetical protein